MIKVDLHDTIRLQPLPSSDGAIEFNICKTRATASDEVPTNESNLLIQAIERMRRHYGVTEGFRVELTKRIPTQAGLGGGSADAAAGLIAANVAWNLNAQRDVLIQIASELGSDVPFFLFPSPATCRGRGERVSAYQGSELPRHFLILKPKTGLSTARVFSRLQVPDQPRRLPARVRSGDLFNRLRQPAEQLCPSLSAVSSALSSAGLARHSMTGSGSAFFAVCQSRRHALRAANRLRQNGWIQVFTTEAVRQC